MLGFKPPWELHPEHPPEDSFWRQTGEQALAAWLRQWQLLNHVERETYLKKWRVPDQWRVDFFEDPVVFREWVYGIACEDLLGLAEKLFAMISGQTVKCATFTQNAGLRLDICNKPAAETRQGDLNSLVILKAAWQLMKNGSLEAAALDDPYLIEKHLAVLEGAKLETIKLTSPAYELLLEFSGGIKLQTFTTQAIYDLGDIDQWKLYAADNTVLCAGPGKKLRYELSTPLTTNSK